MASLYWRIKENGKWHFVPNDNFMGDAMNVAYRCECTHCSSLIEAVE